MAGGGAPLRVEVLTDPATVGAVVPAWDALAVRAGRPYSAPGWALACWGALLAPSGARLRVVVCYDGAEVVGVAALALQRRRGVVSARLLGAGPGFRVEPLARPGREGAVAGGIAAALAACRPRPHVVRFEGADADSAWPALLRSAWPGRRRPYVLAGKTTVAPYVDLLPGGAEAWLATRSRTQRQQLRRRRRRIEERGARIEVVDADPAVLADFARLHHQRWEARGGSGALDGAIEAMLADAVAALPPGRLRAAVVRTDTEVVAVQLLLAAGPTTSFWLGGFASTWSAYSPSMLALVDAIGVVGAVGGRRFDLGPGRQPYKDRLADGEEVLRWVDLCPRDRRYPLTRLQLLPRELRGAVVRRLPPAARARAAALVNRRRRSVGGPDARN